MSPVAVSFSSEVSRGLKRTTSCFFGVVIGLALRMNVRSVASSAKVGEKKTLINKHKAQKKTSGTEGAAAQRLCPTYLCNLGGFTI